MLNWNDYRNQLFARIGEIGQVSPATLEGFQALDSAASKTSHLDARTRELIALAVAVTTRCDGCISVHAEAAVKHGATQDEVVEALSVAIALNAGAALVYSARALDALASQK